MKRYTILREWAEYQRDAGKTPSLGRSVLDLLESDARQRAEIRRLRAALRDAKEALEFGPRASHAEVCRRNVSAFRVILVALRPAKATR